MKILLTGGAGFIGSHVADALLARGDRVICVDDFNDYYDPAIKESNVRHLIGHPDFTLVRGDICNEALVRRVFEEHRPDKVIHLAARAGIRQSLKTPLAFVNTNAIGTAYLLEFSVRFGVKNFIFASSSSVYGNKNKTPFHEDDSLDPLNPYAATKLAGELFAKSYAFNHSLPITCLRFFTVYGPRGRPDMAPYLFVSSIMDGKEIIVYGDGTSARDYTYVGDIVRGILAATDANLPYAIINLGNSRPVMLNDFISTIERVTRKKAIKNIQPSRAEESLRTHANTSRAKELLGWEPVTGLEDGMRALFDYLVKQKR